MPPRGVRDSQELFEHIAVTLEMTVVDLADEIGGTPHPTSLKMVKPDPRFCSDPTMVVPPCIVFVDEVPTGSPPIFVRGC